MMLMTLGILLLPIFIVHIYIGRNLEKLPNNHFLLLLSGINLLIFSLVIVDGLFTNTDNGFTALMKLIGFRVNLGNEDLSHYTSVIVFIFQLILELRLAEKPSVINKTNTIS